MCVCVCVLALASRLVHYWQYIAYMCVCVCVCVCVFWPWPRLVIVCVYVCVCVGLGLGWFTIDNIASMCVCVCVCFGLGLGWLLLTKAKTHTHRLLSIITNQGQGKNTHTLRIERGEFRACAKILPGLRWRLAASNRHSSILRAACAVRTLVSFKYITLWAAPISVSITLGHTSAECSESYNRGLVHW